MLISLSGYGKSKTQAERNCEVIQRSLQGTELGPRTCSSSQQEKNKTEERKDEESIINQRSAEEKVGAVEKANE